MMSKSSDMPPIVLLSQKFTHAYYIEEFPVLCIFFSMFSFPMIMVAFFEKKLIQKSLEKRRKVPSSKSDEGGELEEMPAVSSSETSLVFFKST